MQITGTISRKGKSNLIIRYLNMLPSEVRLTIFAILIGVIGGLSAVTFRLMIEIVFTITFVFPYKYFNVPYWILLLIIPALGGIMVGFITQNVSIETKGHGIPEIIDAVSMKRAQINFRVPIAKMVASAITLGVGGSAGREGPIAQISGGFGSNLGRFFHLTTDEKRDLILSGVAAGISATFNTPLGGVLFALEVIRRDKKAPPIIPLIISSVVGSTIGIVFLGKSPSFKFPTNLSFQNVANIPIFIILGLIIGIFSVIWIRGFYFIETNFDKIKLPNYVVAGVGAFLVGLIQLFLLVSNDYREIDFPLLFWLPLDRLGPDLGIDAIHAIDLAFDRQLQLDVAIVLLILSFFSTSITLGSGGSGGIFTPTLFLGVMVGTVFGLLLEPFIGVDVAVLSVLGMAAFFAGSARAPFTAIIMTAEMVGDYLLIIPLMFVVSASWLMSSLLFNRDIFVEKLFRRGIQPQSEFDIIQDILVDEIMIKNVIQVHPKDRLETVIQLMNKSGHTGYPVTDEVSKELLGIITEHDVEHFLHSKQAAQGWAVSDVCTKHVVSVLSGCPLSTAFKIMAGRDINRLPIVSPEHILIGWITRSDIMRAYLHIQQTQLHQDFEENLFESDFFAKKYMVDVDSK